MRPIEIIAEIGVNHNGSMEMASEMIQTAKEAGADVAKFQIYDPERLLDKNHPGLAPHWETILKTQLNKEQVSSLKKKCDEMNIEFFASVFHPKKVKWTEEIGMERYKIASRSIYDEALARAIVDTGKPIILSYGFYDDKLSAIESLLEAGDRRLKRLFCVSKYPTPLGELSLLNFKSALKYYDGFSDHTVGIVASLVAMSLGARIIEKHFTLDRTLPGPDQACSILPSELKLLCKLRDEIEEILY